MGFFFFFFNKNSVGWKTLAWTTGMYPLYTRTSFSSLYFMINSQKTQPTHMTSRRAVRESLPAGDVTVQV